MFKGRAEESSAKAFLDHHHVDLGQTREFCGIPVSTLAVGTYLGNMDEVTDAKVASAVVQALEAGCNFFDTAINYRGQRAERSVGEGIRRAILAGVARREQFYVSTKGGFVPYEKEPVSDLSKLFEEIYVSKNIAKMSDLVGGCHCIEPRYIENQIERSRKNIGIETIDLYYLHNPEMQLDELTERIFYDKLEKAFQALERAVAENRIAAYGMATWNAFREDPTSRTSVQLEKCMAAAESAARAAGRSEHSFKAVQLPLNLAMPEAALLKTQKLGHTMLSAIDAADALGLSVAVSVPLLQSRLCHNLPDFIVDKFPSELSQAHCALAFATGFPNVGSAMVGMKSKDHLAHNLLLLKRKPLSEQQMRAVIQTMIN